MSGSVALPAKFSESIGKASDAVRSAGRIRVVSHYDADGIAAGAVVAGGLAACDKQFHLTMAKGFSDDMVERLAKEGNDMVVFLDMGSGQMDALEGMDGSVVVLDHHQPVRKSKKVLQVNPHMYGVDGMTECCASTLALLLAVALDLSSWRLAPVSLAGIVGDRQHMGGMKALNRQVLDEAVDRKLVTAQKSLNLKGPTVEKAIAESVDPYFVGLSGRRENVLAFLDSMSVDPETPLGSLDEFYQRKLTSMLSLRLMGQGCRPETVEELVTEVLWIPSMDLSAADLADLLNACGRLDHESLGVALSLGDRGALEEAGSLRSEYNGRLMERLLVIESDGVEHMDSLQYLEVDEPSLAGAICGLAMQYILDQSKPTLALSTVSSEVKVSSRGTKYLVSKGLDLAAALRSAAEGVGGVGGGHAVAAGATIPGGKRDEFLASCESAVHRQLG
ncbi:MAG: DHH family phosphoesterase [Methanobacteriota archaeon]|nr:MAG: DHH family phosphoesterase [Euryarchaeota archaeon]